MVKSYLTRHNNSVKKPPPYPSLPTLTNSRPPKESPTTTHQQDYLFCSAKGLKFQSRPTPHSSPLLEFPHKKHRTLRVLWTSRTLPSYSICKAANCSKVGIRKPSSRKASSTASLKQTDSNLEGTVAHAYNPSYSGDTGGQGKSILKFRTTLGNITNLSLRKKKVSFPNILHWFIGYLKQKYEFVPLSGAHWYKT